jgi:hypothetical protein
MTIEIMRDGADMFVIRDGVRIAKRGHPGTLQAKSWIILEPGFRYTLGCVDIEYTPPSPQ